MLFRVIFSSIFFLSIFVMPWWITFAIAAVLLFSFSAYEVLIGGLLLDLLYGNIESIAEITVSFTTGAVVMFLLAHFLRKRLIFYEQR